MAAENAQLRDANFRLAEEVKVLTQQNETLSTVSNSISCAIVKG